MPIELTEGQTWLLAVANGFIKPPVGGYARETSRNFKDGPPDA
jgi:hypothetical protein